MKNGSTRYLEKQLLDAAEDWGMHPTFKELIGRSELLEQKMNYWNKISGPYPLLSFIRF